MGRLARFPFMNPCAPQTVAAKPGRRLQPCVVTASHPGRRPCQEDAAGHWHHGPDAGPLFAIVADGLGGHGGGANAARAALRAAERLWLAGESLPRDGTDFLDRWLRAAHEEVLQEAERLCCPAMTAVVALLAHHDQVCWVHAGDCRLYRIRDGKTLERTRDDSLVQELFELGHIAEHEMGRHPCQNQLRQALGGDFFPCPHHGSAELRPGDVFLLCSDGLWENLHHQELESLALAPPANRHETLRAAVAEAVRRGGKNADNTTAILVAFDLTTSAPPIPWRKLLALAAVAACATAWWLASRKSPPGNLRASVR